jgi:hypothetical protein
MAMLSLLLGVASLVWAIVAFATGRVSAYLAIMSVSLVLLAILLFVMGVILRQGNMVQREMWLLQRAQLARDDTGLLTAEQLEALRNEKT